MRESIPVGDNFRLHHLAEQIVSFTSSLADAGEYRETLPAFCDVVDQLHDENGLADARTTEQPDLSTAEERLHKVDDLDARLEHLKFRRLFIE